jgi:RNA polymerase sigma factor (sigma-70 family)
MTRVGSAPFHTIFPSVNRLLKTMNTSSTEQQEHASPGGVVERTIRAERKRLFDFIRSKVRSSADAEDILQDVFYQLLTSYSVAEPIERLTAWLFTVARNRVIDWYRKRRTASLQSPLPGEADLPPTLEDILFDPSQNPEELYFRSLVWTELADSLDELPDEQRQVFVMHELEGKSFREIAKETGQPMNTLLSRKRYAVLYLRTRLEQLYSELSIV